MPRGQTTRRHRSLQGGLLVPTLAMAGAALVLSFGAARLIERNLAVHGGEAGMEAMRPRMTSERPGEADALPLAAYRDPIVGRNLFDSSAAAREPWETPPVRPFPAKDAVLLATVVADRDDQSSALIATGQDGDIRGYGKGDWLLREARITRIDQGVVMLTSPNGEVRRLAMGWKRAEL